jgi:UDP-glucose 4-epimerase
LKVSGQKILVTGAAGFIGSHVAEILVHCGARVTLLDRTFEKENVWPADLADSFRTIEMDIRKDSFGTHLITEQYAAIVHLAGPASVLLSVKEPYSDFENSLLTTMKLLETLRTKCKETRLIVASSAAVYGNPVSLPTSETDPAYPISPYGVAKLSTERYAAVYSQLYGLHIASLRFFSLYGPGQRKMLIYDLMSRLSEQSDRLTLIGSGKETRDFIFIKDAARAVITVLESGAMAGEVYNVAAGTSYTTLEVARIVARAMGMDPDIDFTGQGRDGDPIKWQANIEKIHRLGFELEFNLSQGIEETVHWYQAPPLS